MQGPWSWPVSPPSSQIFWSSRECQSRALVSLFDICRETKPLKLHIVSLQFAHKLWFYTICDVEQHCNITNICNTTLYRCYCNAVKCHSQRCDILLVRQAGSTGLNSAIKSSIFFQAGKIFKAETLRFILYNKEYFLFFFYLSCSDFQISFKWFSYFAETPLAWAPH